MVILPRVGTTEVLIQEEEHNKEEKWKDMWIELLLGASLQVLKNNVLMNYLGSVSSLLEVRILK